MDNVRRIEVILTVPSIEDTAAWYRRVLGWHSHYDVFNAEGQCTFGSVYWSETGAVPDGATPIPGFNLSRYTGEPEAFTAGGVGFTALIEVGDVDALYERVIAGGLAGTPAPQNQVWGSRTFSITDLNGYKMIFWQQIEQVSLEEVRRRTEKAREGAP